MASNSLPDDFNEQLYLAMYPDVRRAGVDAKQHFLAHGMREGRYYKLPDQPRNGREFLARLNQYASILEIGPFDRPLSREFASPTADLEFADWLSTDELKARARTIPGRNPDGVPHISYITRGKLSDVIIRQFDCVMSSHMIEHSPDLITHLRDVRSVLRPGGTFLFLCPDKRRGPEQFLPESRLPEVVTAFVEQRTRPTLRSVIEHRAFIRHDFATADDPLRKPNEQTWAIIQSAKQEFESREYCDVHVWQFTPKSLLELIEGITSLGLLERPSRCEIRDVGGQIGGLIQW